MSAEPVIAFGQQPCGFLPRRFLVAKIRTARHLQAENARRRSPVTSGLPRAAASDWASPTTC